MIKYDLLTNVPDLSVLVNLWNEEYGFIFPITDELFRRNISNCYKEASYVCYDDDKIVGFIIGKIWNYDYLISKYLDASWISLIYVTPKYRRQGIGTTLLNYACDTFLSLNKKCINLGSDMLNFFPGLPQDLKNFLPWFINRGFESTYQTHDLIKHGNSSDFMLCNDSKYTFRVSTIKDKDKLLSFLNKCFPGRWYFEALLYYENGGDGREYFICLNELNEVIAFSKVCYPNTLIDLISYSHTYRARFEKLGGIGPLGVDPAYRGKHLGSDIVKGSINVLKAYSNDYIIDWTGLLEFYRPMGFEVWKAYFYVNKKL